MGLRDTLQNNSTAVTIGSIVLLVIALGLVAMQFRGPSIPDVGGYWLDVESGEVFAAELGQQPPIKAPSGGDGVRAQLYSCGACSSDEWFGYVETMSGTYLKAEKDGTLDKMNPVERQQFHQSQTMVRLLDDDEWVPRYAPAGRQLIENVRNRCENEGKQVKCEP